MFEPIGGSAPKYTNQGVINPLAAICAGQMLLGFLGEGAAAKAVEAAVIKGDARENPEFGGRKNGIQYLPGWRPGGRSDLSLGVHRGLTIDRGMTRYCLHGCWNKFEVR